MSQANKLGLLLLHARLLQNNTETLVCKEKAEGGIRKGEGGIRKVEGEMRNAECRSRKVGGGSGKSECGKIRAYGRANTVKTEERIS